KKAEVFWRDALRGFTTPTPLGCGHEKAQKQDGRVEEQMIWLDRETTGKIAGLAKNAQITINIMVQGAWAVVLSRYSGETDVVFGATASGRSAPLRGIEKMVGVFINTLPVRLQVNGKETVKSFLRRVKLWQTKAVEYEYSPLVQVQAWSEVPRGTPL